MKFIFSKLLITLVIAVSAVLLVLAIKGYKNDPNYYQLTQSTVVSGPFEASNSTSRYALVEAIVENHTFFFSDALARFGTPDIVKYQGNYFSIFTPGVAFIGIPFYLVGKIIGFPQIITFLSETIAALVNTYLIYVLARKLGAQKVSAAISGFLFLFGTNAFSYALGFTQHHFSVLVILLGLLCACGETKVWKNIALGLLFAAGALIDIPNIFMMLPILIYVAGKHFDFQEVAEKVKVSFQLKVILIAIAMIPLVFLFAYYNHATTGSYTKIAQLIGRANYGQDKQIVLKTQTATPSAQFGHTLPFDTRNAVNGLYILLISNERSWLYYSPIVWLGAVGLYFAYRQKKNSGFAAAVIAVVATDIVMYAMFGDPWGGWSFGPRYLIPAAAVLCSGIGLVLDRFKKSVGFTIILTILVAYSIYVNTLGAVTTSSIPPKQETEALKSPLPYTYEYNLDLAEKNQSSSYVYNSYIASVMSESEFIFLYTMLILLVYLILCIGLFTNDKHYE